MTTPREDLAAAVTKVRDRREPLAAALAERAAAMRRLRDEDGLTFTAIATAAGLTPQRVEKILNATPKPTPSKER